MFKQPHDEAAEALDRWVSWARRCRIPSFVKLQRSIVKHQAAILAAIEHGLSKGRIESMNTKIRLITRVAFGSPSAATNQSSRAEDDPRKEQESRIPCDLPGIQCL